MILLVSGKVNRPFSAFSALCEELLNARSKATVGQDVACFDPARKQPFGR